MTDKLEMIWEEVVIPQPGIHLEGLRKTIKKFSALVVDARTVI